MQQEVLRYRGGKMGVSAVPGSGKTHTLSYLTALLIASDLLQDDQEVLIVTLVNSAVENFSNRVSHFIQEFGLLPETGYRVRTLHGLAHDIVRERPDLACLSDRFQIIDEREADIILTNSVDGWMRTHREVMTRFSLPDLDLSQNRQAIKGWANLAKDIASSFIRVSKDLQADTTVISDRLARMGQPQEFLEMGRDIYIEYQQALNYRSAIDFDDLIRLALQVLQSDPDYLERLRYRWPYILEDEAQDSNELQEKTLRFLAGEDGNWVRVGDPNQAIFETFTTADPKFLLRFLTEPGVQARSLPNSGRSTASIIKLANKLISWSRSPENPVSELQKTLSLPYIEPTPPKDPQPNPPDNPCEIHLHAARQTPDEELQLVARSIRNWLRREENKDKTVAVLVPRNDRGSKLVEELKKHHIEYIELLKSSLSTRQTAEFMGIILRYLSDPTNIRRLQQVYTALHSARDGEKEIAESPKSASQSLKKLNYIEDFLWPHSSGDWLSDQMEQGLSEETGTILAEFREKITRWQQATVLPIDQLLLTISQDIFHDPIELALAHKLALSLEFAARNHPDWVLPDFAEELSLISRNQRRFLGLSEEDTGFNPDEHKGKVIVSTMHKAKGMEWDRVYLLSVNDYDFPFAQPLDNYIGERWFVQGKLNLQEETLAKLKAMLAKDTIGVFVEDGEATLDARLDYAAERLRLFYVGITRAKKELVITWNTGSRGNCQPSLPFQALMQAWEGCNEQLAG
jgi:DNA helicase-2/ATP-dependent DNA helicase PcrA